MPGIFSLYNNLNGTISCYLITCHGCLSGVSIDLPLEDVTLLPLEKLQKIQEGDDIEDRRGHFGHYSIFKTNCEECRDFKSFLDNYEKSRVIA